MRVESLRAYGWLALAMVTVGSIVPASKIIGTSLPPFLAGALRLAIAAAVLLPWAWFRQRETLTAGFDRHDKLLLALQSAAGTVAFTVLMIMGTARTSSADASVVAGTLPAAAALVAILLFGERPALRRLLAVALAAAAIVVVNLPTETRDVAGSGRWIGNAMVLGAILSESLFILLNKRLHRRLPPLSQSAVMTVLGLAFMLGPAAIEFRSTDVDAVPVVAWLSVAYYGLVPTVLGFVWWYKGAERVSGAEAGVMTAVMPLAAAGLSALVLSEPLGIQHALGLFLAISAILLTARG